MSPKNKPDEEFEDYSERYIRWQGIRIEQMGYVNNLLIGLTSGSLVWLGDYLLTNGVSANIFFLLSPLFFSISLVLGFSTAWNRLKDFRLTAQVLRSLVEEPTSIATQGTKTKRKEMRTDAKNLGEASWTLLRWQIITFSIGLGFAALAVACHITYTK